MALVTTPAPRAKALCFTPLQCSNHRPAQIVSRNHNAKNGESLHHATKFILQSYREYGFKEKNINGNRVVPIVNAASASVPVPEEKKDSSFGRILLSDVVVTRKRNVYWGRKWNSMDVGTVGVVVAMHLLCLFAPFTFNWGAFWVAVGLYLITGLLGITLSFHRNLSHRSFKIPKWLEYFFAYCGVLALQGSPIDWVSTHRYHHQFCDSERDPHSPTGGFWFSHMSWMFDTKSITERCGEPNNVGDLEKQPYYKFLKNTYIIHPIAVGALLYAIGGFPFIVWGMVSFWWTAAAELSSTMA